MTAWYREGKLTSRVDVSTGLENFPEALGRLFSGDGFGSWCWRSATSDARRRGPCSSAKSAVSARFSRVVERATSTSELAFASLGLLVLDQRGSRRVRQRGLARRTLWPEPKLGPRSTVGAGLPGERVAVRVDGSGDN